MKSKKGYRYFHYYNVYKEMSLKLSYISIFLII